MEQDLVSNNSRPLAEACNSAGEGYSVSAHSDMHCLQKRAVGQVKSSKDAGHAASAAEDYAASECGEPNSPEHVSKSKSLNAFMAAKLADAVSKGTSEGKAKKRQRQESDDEESRCTVSDTEMTNGGDEGSNAPSRGNGRGRGRSSRGGRGPTEAGSGRGGRGSRGKGGRGGQDRKALPMVPGQKKKRGRPSKQDIAERQAYQAAVEAEEARAAEEAAAEEAAKAAAAQQAAHTPVGKQRQAGQPAAKATALPVPTADLDPPAQQSTSVSPAAEAKAAAGKPLGKPQSKQPGAGAVGNGKGNKPVPSSPKGRSLSPKGRTLSPKGRPQQKAAAAVPAPASPVHDASDGPEQQRRVPLEQVLKSTEPGVKTPATGNDGQGLKRLKKQPPASKQQTKLAGQHAQQGFELEDDVPAPNKVAEPKHVEILVTADAMDVDIDEPGCARSRPWTKHKLQLDAQAGDLVADQAMEPADPPAALPAARAADPTSPTAAAKLPTDVIEQTGSGGAGHATAAPPDHDLPHQPLKASRGDASAAAAQQHDNEERRNIQHKPRTSRTSPATQLPQKEATAQEQQAQTGDSRARTGNTQPKGRRPGATGVTGSPASDRHTEGSTQNASPAASEEDRRSEDSSGNATPVQHGVGGTSGNNMAIVAAEAPESSSHTGRQGALVVQPQNDAACPAWFSGFMQMNQSANQNVDDKLTIMAGKQDTTLAAVQGMQKSQGIITKVGRKHINMGGLYKKARRWRVEERHRFISNQLYPNDSDSGLGYREQFQQVVIPSSPIHHLQVLGQLDDCLEEAGIHRGHVTEVRVHMLNLEKGQKHVSQVFDDWTDGLPDFGPMLKFTSGKTGHEEVKLLMEASALVPPEAQHLHGGPPIVTSKPMEIDNK
ncbi:MAG: hypothetical protein FRX49_09955 [Trebouxia sp. A1-2]|nr:MAG: hypothetical protein FRX49_09955 [Trebouxia sp. A1-2]